MFQYENTRVIRNLNNLQKIMQRKRKLCPKHLVHLTPQRRKSSLKRDSQLILTAVSRSHYD